MYVRKGADKTIFATVGLSLFPMPQVELYVEDRSSINHIELGMILKSPISEDEIQSIGSYISGQASLPWNCITFLGEGHTISMPTLPNTLLDAVILTQKLDCLPKVELDNFRDSRVNFLWMVPISNKERLMTKEKGSEVLLQKLNQIGEDIYLLNRDEVI